MLSSLAVKNGLLLELWFYSFTVQKVSWNCTGLKSFKHLFSIDSPNNFEDGSKDFSPGDLKVWINRSQCKYDLDLRVLEFGLETFDFENVVFTLFAFGETSFGFSKMVFGFEVFVFGETFIGFGVFVFGETLFSFEAFSFSAVDASFCFINLGDKNFSFGVFKLGRAVLAFGKEGLNFWAAGFELELTFFNLSDVSLGGVIFAFWLEFFGESSFDFVETVLAFRETLFDLPASIFDFDKEGFDAPILCLPIFGFDFSSGIALDTRMWFLVQASSEFTASPINFESCEILIVKRL